MKYKVQIYRLHPQPPPAFCKMSSRCRLEPEKEVENSENNYNQNFSGLYCTCSRPYPDPEDPLEDVMIQCVVCEDWYHGRHLARDSDTSGPPPEENLYAEMICYGCVGKFSFLQSPQPFTIYNLRNKEWKQ